MLPCRKPPAHAPHRSAPTGGPLARWRTSCAPCVALLSLALFAGSASAFQLTSIRPTKDASELWVEVQLDQPIEPRVAGSLGRGMPATLTVHAELWRRRNGWFDRMERAVDATYRMRYDVWSDTWRLDRPGAPTLTLGTLDSLQAALEQTKVIPISPLDRISPQTSYYLVVSASLRPLNVEDVEEVEGWLSGEVHEKRHSGLGVLTGIPRSLFEAARNFAGFGDERSRLISTDFTPENLRVERYSPASPAGH